ncbi:pas domain-containing protein : PAS domain S-box OS=Methanobacterium sp. Maddingley MBC34 GN=B655_1763 PE=4 SV=1: MASE1: PAS_3: PAS_4: PAS_8: PAS_4: PAS_4: PAS_9: HisKA_2: HATPase_c [Gemmata massiliana]|uniref:histidine kinase n=1 Tax=Gemmata massiliana TaxID=1210884 RepID=A0A6P2D0K0_9BACT|nr:PAS domain S-box protein [Gemmata massiliana]VTR92980.1 pas domain-containing protein : PAS domain S-box OS=Methanobacterium sp. Maddingley MBC34 GN=B655_1763 PE=4 SV=1: MASE1: PAS_3: PAS_4: PAS_8: PAS_4: PAS_4: PAS_9: HisKA_2: HATPase_c [Gemmata massiliana]
MESQLSRWRPWAVVLGLALAYIVTARLGFTLGLPPDRKVTAIWPPSGIAFAALLIFGLRVWPGIWLGSFLANVWDAFDPAHSGTFVAHVGASAVIATGSTLQALAGAGLVRRFIGPGYPLDRVRNVFRFVAVVPVVCLIAATLGVTALCASGLVPWGAFGTLWWTWWLGDAVGVLVVAPVLLAWVRPLAPGAPRPTDAETVCLFALLLGACVLVFGGWRAGVSASPLAYLSLPLLVWAAVRFGSRGSALTVVVIAAFAIWGTVSGSGPFVRADVYESLLLLDIFLAVAVVTALVPCAVLQEREDVERALRASEAKLRQLTEAVPQIVWMSEPDGSLAYLNRQWHEYTGLTGIGPTDLARVVHPDDLKRLRDAGAEAHKLGTVFQHEFRMRPVHGGEYRWFLARSVPVVGPDGAPAGRIGTSTDIDDLKHAQSEMVRQQADLQLILDTVPALIFHKDRDHRLVRVNNELVRLVGLPREALQGRTDAGIGSPHAEQYRLDDEAIMTEAREVRGAIEPLYTITGTRWLQTSKLPYRDATGRVTGLIGFSVDVTEQKLAQDEVRRLNAELEQRVAERTAVAEARTAELQRAVEALREQKQLLQTVLDSLGEAVLVVDKNGRFLMQNRAFRQLHPEPTENLSPIERARVNGVYLADGSGPCPPDQLPIFRAMRGESCDNVELMTVSNAHPDGVPISVTGRPILGPSGVEGGVIAIRNVSETRAVASALRESEKRFRAIFDQTFQFIGLMAADGTLLEANRTALAAAGLSEAEVLGKPFWDTPWWTHDPVQRDRLQDAVARANRGETVRFVTTHRAASGELLWVDFSLKPFHNENGVVTLLIPEGRDITAIKRSADALEAADTLLRQFIKHAPAAIAMLDTEMRYVQASDRWLTDYHLTGQNVIGRSHYEVFPDIPERWKQAHRRVLAGAVEMCSEDPFPRADGGMEWLQWEARPWRKARGEIGGLVFYTQVITDRIRAADALRESEERFRSAFDSAPIGVALVSPDGRWLKVNQSVCALVGYSEAELLTIDFQTITHPDDLGADLALVEQVLRGELPSYQMEKRYFHKTGHVIDVLLSVSLVRDARGQPLYFISQIQDITERKRAEVRLLASVHEKEVMLKEIHHRVKNNLQIISTLLDLQSDGITDPAALAAFRESRGRVRSMALIHERLYRSENLASVEFGTYVRNLAEDLFRAYRADDEAIRLAVSVSVPPVPLDIAIPCGLLVNELISNCLKYAFADREGGMIAVSLAPEEPGTHLLTVADDGVGLPPGFDFRHTTSFGLQLVNTLVEQLGGDIALDGTSGTRFTIRFPARG